MIPFKDGGEEDALLFMVDFEIALLGKETACLIIQLFVQVSRSKGAPWETGATPGSAVQCKMDAWIGKTLPHDTVLQRVKTLLLSTERHLLKEKEPTLFRHKKEHFARAVLEGITRSIYRITESIQSMLDRRANEIRVTGGLAASPVWLQMGADLFGASIVVPDTTEGSARGAAMLAAVALGIRSDLKSLAGGVLPKEKFDPRPEVHAFYESNTRRLSGLSAVPGVFRQNVKA